MYKKCTAGRPEVYKIASVTGRCCTGQIYFARKSVQIKSMQMCTTNYVQAAPFGTELYGRQISTKEVYLSVDHICEKSFDQIVDSSKRKKVEKFVCTRRLSFFHTGGQSLSLSIRHDRFILSRCLRGLWTRPPKTASKAASFPMPEPVQEMLGPLSPTISTLLPSAGESRSSPHFLSPLRQSVWGLLVAL